jgi:hypothetical protein
MNEELFAGTRTPRAPDDLRERALRAARAAAHEQTAPERTGWRFNRFDLAWVAALLVLVVCHALLSLPRWASPVAPVRSQAIAEERQLEKELGLKVVPMVVAGRDTGRNGDVQKHLMQELERL